MRKILSLILGVCLLFTASAFAQYNPITQQRGGIYASDFAYGYGQVPGIGVGAGGGNAGTTYTIYANYGYFSTPTGLQVFPFSTTVPITVGNNTAFETVIPTSVSCSTPQLYQTCAITASFTYAHGPGDTIRTGTFGLADAMYYAFQRGGGLVTVDYQWGVLGGSTATINALSSTGTSGIVYWNVGIQDLRAATPVFWNPTATASTILGTPTTLTNSTAYFTTNAATGNYGTGTYHMCISLVDAMGNEGPCSADYSHAGLATSYITFTPPTSTTSGTMAGAVGYTMYVGLTAGGTYNLLYKVPITSSVCTMTPYAPIPACAVANTAYGQSAATATVTAITLASSPTAVFTGVISTAAIIHGQAIAMQTYGYYPSSKPLTGGPMAVMAFPAPLTAADTTGVGVTLATIAIPTGYMNQVGRSIRVCGLASSTGTSTGTLFQIIFYWDAVGQDNAGLPVIVANQQVTITLASAVDNINFCQVLTTQVAGAGATAGTIIGGTGWLTIGDTVANTHPSAGGNSLIAATTSLNLAQDARLHVVYNHTNASDSAGFILQHLTVEPL
jgi:hypothetical protein